MAVSYVKLHSNIISARNHAGYTQEHMAEMLGISLNQYSRLERGETPMTLCRLEKIASALGVPAPFLLVGVFEEKIDDDIEKKNTIEKISILLKETSSEKLSFILEMIALQNRYWE